MQSRNSGQLPPDNRIALQFKGGELQRSPRYQCRGSLAGNRAVQRAGMAGGFDETEIPLLTQAQIPEHCRAEDDHQGTSVGDGNGFPA